MRFLMRVLALPLLACALSDSAVAQPVPLKIGIVPFDDPRGREITDTEASLRAYFRGVEIRSGNRVQFTLKKGNYYQILHWMRDGAIDGAVVSSFTAHVMRHDHKLSTLPVIEFERGEQGVPKVWATSAGNVVKNPIAKLERCLDQVLAPIRGLPTHDLPCEFRMVSHLSSTGFVAPLIYIEEQFVRRKGVTEEAEFWTRLLQKTRLELWHDANVPVQKGKTIIRFTYAPGATRVKLLEQNPLPSLNDVLLVRCKATRPGCVSREGSIPVTRPEEIAWWRDGAETDIRSVVRTVGSPWTGYARATQWSGDDRDKFTQRIESVFRNGSALGALYDRWYVRGQYAFSIDEVVDILRFDQTIRDNPRAALVLPGGGVRATYQSVILDYLYREKIVNAGERQAGRDAPCSATIVPKQDRLVINGIAGTSGGALLGYLASRHDTRQKDMLRKQWIEAGEVKTKPLDIFPALGVLRWLSLLLLVTVFAATTAIHLPQLNRPPKKEVPFWYTTFVSVVLVVAPFLIWRNASKDPTYYAYGEGLAFFAVVAFVHFIHSTSSRDGKQLGRPWLWAGIATMVLGMVMAFVLVKSQHLFQHAAADLKAAKWISAGWSFASAMTLLFFIFGLSMIAGTNGTRRAPHRLTQYRKSLTALLLLLLLATAMFGVGVLANQVTPLEMTIDYWIWVFLSALFGAKLIITAARVYPDRPQLIHGVRFLNTPTGTVPFPYTPAVSLVAWGALGIVVWLLFLAPAIYTSRNGESAFERAVAIGPKQEMVPLIVSMTGLGNDVPGYKKPAYRGDYYAVDERWCNVDDPDETTTAQLFRLPSQRFRKAVFASGSPFPIYPATRVEAEATPQKPGLFVDGGYAHRVPIEAAGLVRAAQILVVENVTRQEAAPAKGFRAGALTANLGNTFSFLFDRSQTPDLQRRRSAVVATIYPDWSPPDPFLMDFRESVVNRLWSEAEGDLEGHRVARIESWGLPKAGGL